MLGETMGDFGGRLLLATSGVGLALIALVAVLRFMRRHNGRLPFGLSVAQSTEKRLQVLDTVAIDARRRLVLIRRDHVEHLILIGAWDEARQEAMDREVAEQVRAAQKEAEKLGILHDGLKQPFDSMFEDVFEEMPRHLKDQLAQMTAERKAAGI